MKKVAIFSLAAVLFLGMALTSCEKYDVSTPYEINDSISATISGYVKAPLDYSDDDEEFAPSGTKIYLKVELTEFNPNAPAGEFKTYSTTVGSNGMYEFTLPSNENGVSFTIMAEDFRATQVLWDDSTDEVIFSAGNYEGTVISDQKYIQDINYFEN